MIAVRAVSDVTMCVQACSELWIILYHITLNTAFVPTPCPSPNTQPAPNSHWFIDIDAIRPRCFKINRERSFARRGVLKRGYLWGHFVLNFGFSGEIRHHADCLHKTNGTESCSWLVWRRNSAKLVYFFKWILVDCVCVCEGGGAQKTRFLTNSLKFYNKYCGTRAPGPTLLRGPCEAIENLTLTLCKCQKWKE